LQELVEIDRLVVVLSLFRLVQLVYQLRDLARLRLVSERSQGDFQI
jgi:hypothetical protein